jgi:hypothetical protein
MKKLFLEIEENEKNRILEMHQKHSNSYNNDLINENVLRNFFKNITSGSKSIPTIVKDWAKLSSKDKGEALKKLFSSLKGKQKDTIGQIITNNEKFIKQYLRATEEETVALLKASGKYTDDEISSLIKGHKMNTTGSFTGEWRGYGRSKGSYGRFFGGSKVTERIKQLTPEGTNFSKLSPSKREEIIQRAITDVAKSGTKITFRDFIKSMKKELLIGSGVASLIMTIGIWNSLKNANAEGLPPFEEIEGVDIVNMDETDVEPVVSYSLGDRILKIGSKGDDVKELQQKLVSFNFDLGNFGPNGDGIDGKYGNVTSNVIKKIQQQSGIKVDGIYGPNTHKALMNYKPNSTEVDVNTTKIDDDKIEDVKIEDIKELTPIEIKKNDNTITDDIIDNEQIMAVEAPSNVEETEVLNVVERGRNKCLGNKERYLKKTKQRNNKTIHIYGCK